MSLFAFFRSYTKLLIPLLIVSLFANTIGLILPKLIAGYIDGYSNTGTFSVGTILTVLIAVTLIIALFTLLQSGLSSYLSEKVAYDIRQQLAQKIAKQSFNYVSTTTVPKLLTIVTSDVDAVKNLISMGIVAIFAAVLTLVGAVIALLSIHVQLALITLISLPVLVIAFMLIFGRIGKLFKQSQENLEKINKVVNESIVSASLVRVLNSQAQEIDKFDTVNANAKNIGIAIVKGFSSLIPIINLVANSTVLLILWFGGSDVMRGDLTLGSFSAFFAYANMLIMPIFIIGFISSNISRSFISWGRINQILQAPIEEVNGDYIGPIEGRISFEHVNLSYQSKTVLKDISFTIEPGTRNAIVGPVSAGKTQLLYLMAGLIQPQSGTVLVDEKPLPTFDRNKLLRTMGFVFQDSLILNATLRENIQLHEDINEEDVKRAITTAQLEDLVQSLPQGLDTPISERGSNLSGGQKQRLMLARALALNPKVLLLDDFTARVDKTTEQSIIQAIQKNYPHITLISITQKVDPIKEYDQIIVVMEGELIAKGTHEELLEQSLEYKQICESQKTSE